ncbi:class I SAM-dependent methyltransferase [Dactylosporangium sp. AC04546]|uniref:class I SAM-dependent methyltransferase n=1 Tax=Dactylosporangium sp. AC04546 TaxID=2862460 RepID=UPI001EE0657F|nr:class I SAM-dependent methyltransferase [Dactylosporangium sp. AC04546]WVK87939.1 class I SAM-dependent methyltransferase [Dactylosporangium sp. AC04546]
MTDNQAAYLATTSESWTAVAEAYAEESRSALDFKPFGRAMLGVFAELVDGLVADLGCGPGNTTEHLHRLGLEVFGVDLAPGMVAVARRAYPHLSFEVGTMTALDLPPGELGGILAWYSIVNTPLGDLPRVFAEFHRVLAPGGHVLLGFQVRSESRHVTHGFGSEISLDFHRHPPEAVTGLLGDAGFAVLAQLLREPDDQEHSRQAHILARKR